MREKKCRMELEDAKQKMQHLASECRKALQLVIQTKGCDPQILKAI